ncbi:hypothetical protein NCS56_00765200 [Fusarium sp. Ph1]|nr:hypothetical protein NCS56_00765200 [Fusarium sp. Ph1]
MDSSSIGSNDEAFEDTLCKPSLTGKRDEAKVATEKFLLDAISKADAHLGPSSLKLKSSLDELFRDLSEVSGLCSWHGWKLARLLSLVRADGCNLEMIQTLEEPLTNFFSGGFGDDFLVSVKDYTFYTGIKLEECTEYGGVDIDLLRWARGNARIYDDVRGRIPAMRSGEDNSMAVETLGAIETRLEEWKCCIRSMRTKKGKF